MTAAETIAGRLLERNRVCEGFFAGEAARLAEACRRMAARFQRGGRLLAFGRAACATDAQHVSVEFLHPVVVGKRALAAADLSALFASSLPSLLQPDDIVMGFAPPEGDPEIGRALYAARRRGAMTFALPGCDADYSIPSPSADPFVQQEIIEILYHTLWETVHVFLEHDELPSGAGDAGFLYPFLGGAPGDTSALTAEVAQSIRMKVDDDARLRAQVASEQAANIVSAIETIAACVRRGGKLILFGNGGSATDANDWAIDCVCPPPGLRPIPAVSLSTEPAVLTAIANDVGPEVMFLRQLIAHARPADVVIGISTSGGSRNLIAAFDEARRRGLPVVALLGSDGGEVLRRSLADHPILVRCDYIPRIQEVQASIYHLIRELHEDECFHA